MAREPGKDMTGVLFTAPAGGERRGAFEPHARVLHRELGDDARGAVGGMIVEDDDFKLHSRLASTAASVARMFFSSLRAGMRTEMGFVL